MMKKLIKDVWKETTDGLGIGLKKDAVEIRLFISKDVFNKDLLTASLQVRGFQIDLPRIIDGEDTTKIIHSLGVKGTDTGNLINKLVREFEEMDDIDNYEIVSQCSFGANEEFKNSSSECEEGYVNNAVDTLVKNGLSYTNDISN